MKLFIYILTVLYFVIVSIPIFIIIFILTQLFYTLKNLTKWQSKQQSSSW